MRIDLSIGTAIIVLVALALYALGFTFGEILADAEHFFVLAPARPQVTGLVMPITKDVNPSFVYNAIA